MMYYYCEIKKKRTNINGEKKRIKDDLQQKTVVQEVSKGLSCKM